MESKEIAGRNFHTLKDSGRIRSVGNVPLNGLTKSYSLVRSRIK